MRHTPTEVHDVDGIPVYVKREDRACPRPGPPFAKVRGLGPFMEDLQKKGVETVAYMETSVSMAGWGISYFAKMLGMKAVIFTPHYKEGPRENQASQKKAWEKFGAEIILLEKPNRQKINFHRAKKLLHEKYPNAYMLPQGLPFKQTIEAVAEEVHWVPREVLGGTLVSCIGSGAMAAGIIKGINQIFAYKIQYYKGISVAPKDLFSLRTRILKQAGVKPPGLMHRNAVKFEILSMGYEYTDQEKCPCPFPCNTYYDRKAWKWLVDNVHSLPQPILFWNIGA